MGMVRGMVRLSQRMREDEDDSEVRMSHQVSIGGADEWMEGKGRGRMTKARWMEGESQTDKQSPLGYSCCRLDGHAYLLDARR